MIASNQIAKLLALAAAGLFCGYAQAQSYPNKPVKIIVPHPSGGGPVDLPARGLAEFFTRSMGQTFVVENRDGADGFIGAEALAKSNADGYTLGVTSASVITMNELTRHTLPYNPSRDFAPVAYIGAIESLLLVHVSVPAKSLPELLDLARAKPGTVTWGTLGTTSNGPLLIGMFKQSQGVQFYMIPYKSNIQAVQGTVAGDVNVVAYAAGGAMPFIKAGKLRPLAYTGSKRNSDLPEVPTFGEQGIKLGFKTWIGMFAPAKVPTDIVRRLNSEAVKLLSDASFTQKFLNSQGVEAGDVSRSSPEEFAQFIRTDRAAYEEAVKGAGIEKR
ncbi:MAG: Bug family tripartite tricarboxylate transporter substrate binding protein [Burkholderiales bacterium]